MPLPYWKALWDAVHVETREQAEETLETLIKRCQEEDPSLGYEKAKAIQLSNIGWFFGEINRDDRIHALEIWPEAEHPIFARDLDVTPDAAFSAGMVLAQHLNQGDDTQTAQAAARKAVKGIIDAD